MKKNKFYILQTWMMLLCFVAGQYMVYAHNHAGNVSTTKSAAYHPQAQPKQILTESCQLCDAMHHNAMATISHAYFAPVTVTSYFYKAVEHHFISVSLVLSAGRSPPIS